MSSRKSKTFNKDCLIELIKKKINASDDDILYISGYANTEHFINTGHNKENYEVLLNKLYSFLEKGKNNEKTVLVLFDPECQVYMITCLGLKHYPTIQFLNSKEYIPMVKRFLEKPVMQYITECPICFDEAPTDEDEYFNWFDGCVRCSTGICKKCFNDSVLIKEGVCYENVHVCPFCRFEVQHLKKVIDLI